MHPAGSGQKNNIPLDKARGDGPSSSERQGGGVVHDLSHGKLAEIYLGDGGALLERVGQVVRPHFRDAVNVFYSELLSHPDADFILNEETVAARLTESLRKWLEDLFAAKTDADITALIERQRHVGRMHARINVPMHLVVEGVRVLRRELSARMQESSMDRNELVYGIVMINELLDHVMSLMNDSYIGDVVADERNIQSLQMQLAPQSLALEMERLRAGAFDWLVEATALLLGDAARNMRLTPLRRAEIGLWLSHKAPLFLSDERDLTRFDEQITRIDEKFAAALKRRRRGREGMADAVGELREDISHLAWLIAQFSGRVLEMENGRDPLTRLFNRRYLPTILKHEAGISLRHDLPFGALLFDIDHFKKINDTHGHDGGDAVLRQFAQVIVETVRANDFVFRYGGEEYLVVLGDVDEEAALQIAEKIRQTVAAYPFEIGPSQKIAITTSVGVAIHDGHPDYQRTITRADEALYKAKHEGRNRSVVSPRPERQTIGDGQKKTLDRASTADLSVADPAEI